MWKTAEIFLKIDLEKRFDKIPNKMHFEEFERLKASTIFCNALDGQNRFFDRNKFET